MTKQEFECRVKMTVNNYEYNAIEVVYMQSDLGKDEFCKVWANMNKSRINAAREARIYREQELAKREALWNVYHKLEKYGFEESYMETIKVLNKKEVKACQYAGLELEDCKFNLSIANVRYHIYQFLTNN